MTNQEKKTVTDPTNVEQAQIAYDVSKGLADAERSKIADARDAVEKAETELATAAAKFKERPTSSSASAKLVAQQVLENAQEACAAVEQAAVEVLQAETRAKVTLDYANAAAEMASYDTDIDAEVAAILDAEAKIREAVARMTSRNAKMRASVRVIEHATGKGGLPPVRNQYVEDFYLPDRVKRALLRKYGNQAFTYGEVKSVHEWIHPNIVG